MRTVPELLEQNIHSIKLNILLFGPSLEGTSRSDREESLRNKRRAIRLNLENAGHRVDYPEEIIDRNLPEPALNPALQELLIAREYDLIVNLVETPGTIFEAGMFATKPDIASKSILFICEEFRDGLPYKGCQQYKTLEGQLFEFKYPDDIVACHLVGKVAEQISRIQIGRYLSLG
jgi:hypothetical protein